MTPTLVASRTALPPGGAAVPAVWQSQSRGPCWWGKDVAMLVASRTALLPGGAAAPVARRSWFYGLCWLESPLPRAVVESVF